MNDYKKLGAGYNFATFNLSYATGAGYTERLLSFLFTLKGYHTSQSSL